MYYRNAAAAVVVYDITKAASLEKAKAWVKELQRQANPNIVIALVGNKLDLVEGADGEAASSETPVEEPVAETADETAADDDDTPPPPSATPAAADGPRQVSTAEAKAYADECGLLFFEASAKQGTNVQNVFTEIGECKRMSRRRFSKRALKVVLTIQPRLSRSTPLRQSPLLAVHRAAALPPTLLQGTLSASTSARVRLPRRAAAVKVWDHRCLDLLSPGHFFIFLSLPLVNDPTYNNTCRGRATYTYSFLLRRAAAVRNDT
jgi:hypothetical protein